MKEIFKKVAAAKMIKCFCKATVLFMLLSVPLGSTAQTDSTKKEVPEEKEELSLIAPAMEFISVQKSDNTIDLKATLKSKIKGSFIKLPLLKVSFLLVADTAEKPLGFAISDPNGKAVLNVKADALAPDKDGKLHFKAVFAGNKQMEPADGEVTVTKAKLEITPVKEDSILTVNIKLIGTGKAGDSSVKDVVVGVYVARLFNPMKIGEGTTDENGEASVEFPKNLPGDAKGNLTLLAKLDENETFGNLEATSVQKWGTVVSDKIENQPRALWSSHPPIWMLVTFCILMGVVWGHYIVIVVQLFRLRKEEPTISAS